MPGELDTKIQETLNRGIETVLSEEFPINSYVEQAAKLINDGNELNIFVKTVTAPQRIVNAAAAATAKEFQLNDLKAKVKKVFFTGIQSTTDINTDHSSSEDDEFINALKNALNEKNKTIEDMTKFMENFLKKRGFNKAQQAANEIEDSVRNEQYVKIADFMIQGYTFLAKLGETIRGSTIIYEVTMGAGSASMQRSGYFSLDELMKYTYIEMHRGTFSLRLDNTKINESKKFFQWSNEAKQAYKSIKTLAKNSIDLSNMNEGQLTEAFRDAANLIFNEGLKEQLGNDPEQLLMEDPHGIHYYLHSAYTDRTKYYQAGDIVANIDSMFKIFEEQEQQQARKQVEELVDINKLKGNIEVQEKGSGATFTTFGGLLSSLKKAKKALEELQKSKNKIASKTKDINGFDDQLVKIAEDLVKQFLPGAS